MASLPFRFRRPRLLIAGCGDIGLRVLRALPARRRVVALTSSPERRAELRRAGAVPIVADLDDRRTLTRLAGLADALLHLAPPPSTGVTDPRSVNLLRALLRRGRGPTRIVYCSTSGVYGDCAGVRFDETRGVRPSTDRARRRVDAEQRLRRHGRRHGARVTILRIPGIYALDRAGGDPRARLRRAAPVLEAAHDIHTNHIHADDLARACIAALHRGRPQRIVHASDDSALKMGDHFDLVADLAGLPRPPRVSVAAARALLTPMQASFMGESRRLDNGRLKRELRLRLLHPTVRSAFAAGPTGA